jgi:hypothetical protein
MDPRNGVRVPVFARRHASLALSGMGEAMHEHERTL